MVFLFRKSCVFNCSGFRKLNDLDVMDATKIYDLGNVKAVQVQLSDGGLYGYFPKAYGRNI